MSGASAVDDTAALAPGAEILSGYRVLRRLHAAAQSQVYEVWSDERQANCIVKLAPHSDGEAAARRRLVEEGRLLLRLSHPQIVRCYEVEEERAAIVLERLPGMTMHSMVHALHRLTPWPDLLTWAVQLGSALHYLHGRSRLHLDVKPGNVFVRDGGGAVLIDFNLALPPGPVSRKRGTRAYAAPEVVNHGIAGPEADVWGLGCALFEAATGRAPFVGEFAEHDTPQLYCRAPRVRELRDLPARLAEAIDACLEPDAILRPSLPGLLAHLQT